MSFPASQRKQRAKRRSTRVAWLGGTAVIAAAFLMFFARIEGPVQALVSLSIPLAAPVHLPLFLPEPADDSGGALDVSEVAFSAPVATTDILKTVQFSEVDNALAERDNDQWSLSLTNDAGRVIHPRFYRDKDTARISLDERSFVPGFYTLRLRTPAEDSGEDVVMEQSVAWGVLAMNTDQDRYSPGGKVTIAFGVLDARGEIICDSSLQLSVKAPDGIKTVLSTADGSIKVGDACGKKIGGLLDPDYFAILDVPQLGSYALTLSSTPPSGVTTASLDAILEVVENPPLIIRRKAATRLWPFRPSTMVIDVLFAEDFSGDIVDSAPQGFVILESEPPAIFATTGVSQDIQMRWSGTWKAGEQAQFRYTYDAPDISPAFYLIGPLALRSSDGFVEREKRAWQIANDAADSANYILSTDMQPSGGGEGARSANYRLSDTIGEGNIGLSGTNGYLLNAGYRQTTETFLSMACSTSVSLGTITSAGQATGSGTCLVRTDSQAGYALSWQVRTGSGGVSTGSLISQHENVIRPFSPTIAGTPNTWTVPSTRSAWGGRLRSSSSDTDVKWGIDAVSEKWLNVGTGSYSVVQRTSATSVQGSSEIMQFRAEIGSLFVQPTGIYEATVTMTATAP